MPLHNPGATTEISTGVYSGDDSANRAIPHGLTKTPKIVIIHIHYPTSTSRGDNCCILLIGSTDIWYLGGGANSELDVTTMDSTNFYVGNATSYPNSANWQSGSATYIWVALT